MVTPSIIGLVVISYIVVNLSDQMIQEQDYVYDSLLLICVGALWITQPAHLRTRDLYSIAVIVVCIKLIYLFDNEHGVNRAIEPELDEMKHTA